MTPSHSRALIGWILCAASPIWAQDGLPLETAPPRATAKPTVTTDCPPELKERTQALALDLREAGYRGKIESRLDPETGLPAWQATLHGTSFHPLLVYCKGYASARAALEQTPIAYLVLSRISVAGADRRRELISIRGGQRFEVNVTDDAGALDQAERLLALFVRRLAIDPDLPEALRLSYWGGRCAFEVQRDQVGDDDELILTAKQVLEQLRGQVSSNAPPVRVRWLALDHVLADDEVSRLDVHMTPTTLRVRRWLLTPPVADTHGAGCECHVVIEGPARGLADALPAGAE